MNNESNQQHANELELWPLTAIDGEIVGGDLEDVELRQWLSTPAGQEAARRQRLRDGQVNAALNEVTVPAGAADRLLGTWRASEESRTDSGETDHTAAELVGVASLANSSISDWPRRGGAIELVRARRSRRWLAYSSVACLLLAVAGTVAAWMFWFEPQPMGRTELAQSSLGWAGSLDSRSWREVDARVLASAPIPEELATDPVRYAVIATDWDAETVVYDLVGPEQRTVWLYVIDVRGSFAVPERFSLAPDYTTGQFAVGSMLRGGRLYVLMVEGDALRYRRQIRGVGPLG